MLYWKDEVKFLGLIVNATEVYIDPVRIAAINKYPRPADQKAVQRFLGMVKYLGTYVGNIALNSEKLLNLTHKNVAFTWTPEHEKEFNYLKKLITSMPILSYFYPQLPIMFEIDSSQSRIGSCLFQKGHIQ